MTPTPLPKLILMRLALPAIGLWLALWVWSLLLWAILPETPR